MMVNNVVNMNEDLYTTYFLQQRRDFDAFILYDRKPLQLQIVSVSFCLASLSHSATNKEFATVAKAYENVKGQSDRNVLFIRIAIDNSLRVFQYHDFQTAPIITYLPAAEIMQKKVGLLSPIEFSSIPTTITIWTSPCVRRALHRSSAPRFI